MNHLSQDQITAVLEAAKDDPVMYCIILLSFRHALRVSEAIRLQRKNFDLTGGGYLTVQRLKGSLKTTQPLFPDERAAVEKFLVGKNREDRLWFISRHVALGRFKKLCAQVGGIPEKARRFHALKHSAGHVVIKAGIEYARQYMGHKSIASTGAYVRVSDEVAAAAVLPLFG